MSRGQAMLDLQESSEQFDHSSRLTPFIELVLSRSGHTAQELDAVSISAGPGSYTGLRVGVSAAKALCFGLDIPLIAVDTLEALAFDIVYNLEIEEALIMPTLDARRNEVYTALFDSTGRRLTADMPWVVDRDNIHPLLQSGEKVLICGEGAEKSREILGENGGISYHPTACSASGLIVLAHRFFEMGKFSDTAYFTPNYLKDPHITIPRKTLI